MNENSISNANDGQDESIKEAEKDMEEATKGEADTENAETAGSEKKAVKQCSEAERSDSAAAEKNNEAECNEDGAEARQCTKADNDKRGNEAEQCIAACDNTDAVSSIEKQPDMADMQPQKDGSAENNRKKRNVRKGIVIIAIIFTVVCLIAAACSFVRSLSGSDTVGGVETGNSSYIAMLYVEGTIQDGNTDYFGQATGYQHQWTLNVIEELMYDSNNCGIIIFVDSPGGSVYESDELYLKIKEYQERTGKPVYAVMGSMAASGGYYISAPCDRIYANRNTWTGSIGVTIGTIVDISGLLERYGVKTETITSGANKAMGSSYQTMSDEEKAIWQGLVDEAYDQFVDIVAYGRDLDKEYVYEIADGRILSAYQAKELGLVDRIGSVEDAYFDMLEETGEYDANIVDVVYESDSLTLSSLLGSITSIVNKSETEADGIIGLVNSINTTPISYYCEALAK